MDQFGLDLLAPSTEEHVYYTSEFPVYQYTFEPETVAFSLIPASPSIEPCLLIPHFTRLTLLQYPTWIPNVIFFGKEYYISRAPEISGARTATVYEAFARAVSDMGLTRSRIGVELDRLSVQAFRSLQKVLPDAQFVDGRAVLQNTRSVKTTEEIFRLKKAAQAIEIGLEAAFSVVKPGMSELDLDRVIRHTLLDQGCTTGYIQAGAGTRGAFGPVYPSDTKIEKGDLIRIDASARYKHYLSDICRMAVVGEPSREMNEIYSAVFTAEMEAVNMIRPGIRVADLFDEVAQIPPSLGVEDFKRNNIGHGIGIISHEHPILSPDSDAVLEKGMVLCLETPYYRWQVGGFAPEDEVLITAGGSQLLTTPQEHLIAL
ncbi:MAG: aminopeptidase P family protein [Spirochaetaceae bacterium]|nr:MAG: aminopeptidase P family protein [Spirochaetaceae bacterium]